MSCTFINFASDKVSQHIQTSLVNSLVVISHLPSVLLPSARSASPAAMGEMVVWWCPRANGCVRAAPSLRAQTTSTAASVIGPGRICPASGSSHA